MPDDDVKELDRLLLGALKTIQEPTGKDLVSAGLVTDLVGEGKSILKVVCRDPGFPEPIKQRLTREIVGKLKDAVAELTEVRVEWRGVAPPPNVPAEPPRIKHIIAVGSGKGGVGKSTVAASLAYALQLRGQRVGLMDSDVYGPSLPHMLGINEPAQVVTEPTLRIVPPKMDGIPVMSMGFLVPPEKAVVWRGPMLHKAVKDFLHAVAWGELDFLIVDLPPGTGDIILSLSQEMPVTGGVIVCTPQDVALLDARKALDMLRTVRIPCLGLVENMSFFVCPNCRARYEIFGHGGARRWAELEEIPFLGEVPINLRVRLNGDAGALRENFSEENPVRANLLAIADALLDRIPADVAGPAIEIVD